MSGSLKRRGEKGCPSWSPARSETAPLRGGEALGREKYEREAEATLPTCGCGGPFRYRAQARCPGCRSTRGRWDRDAAAGRVFYD